MKNILTLSIIILVLSGPYYFSYGQSSNSDKYLLNIGKKESLNSKVLGEERDFWVHIPKGDDYADSQQNYPVVYLLDGSINLQSVTGTLQQLGGGIIPNMIVVGIANQQNRTRDLTPTHVDEPMYKTSGGGERFTEFLENELIPYIDSNYPTTDYRTFIGHSHGGLLVINTLINHPDLFNNYISIDPSIGWDNQKFLKESINALKTKNFSNKSLYLAIANSLDTDTTEVLKDPNNPETIHTRSALQFYKMAEANTSNGLNFNWKYYPDDSHGSVVHVAIYDGLRSLFPWFRIKGANDYLRPNNTVAEATKFINDLYKKRSKHFGYKVLPEEGMLNSLGYSFLFSDQVDKSYAFFKMNIDNYPQSANVYDSMGDYYIALSDNKNALKHLRKAYEISGSGYHKKRIKDVEAKLNE